MLSLLLALTAPVLAQDTAEPPPPPIVGGTVAPPGKWDDTVGIVFNSQYIGCTGTLIGPNTVLTAAHCTGGISHVLVGSTDYEDDSQGAYFQVASEHPHPNYNNFGNDIAVLRLAETAVGYEPRPISQDCTQPFIVDGAETVAVGYGSTRSDGGGYNTELREVTVFITDHDCNDTYGCDQSAPQNSEVVAGGNGYDSCNGDSGGPLYLATDYGYVLLGVTSRPHYEASVTCGDGGVYTRADHYLPWIQSTSGGDVTLTPTCNEPPTVAAVPFDPIRKNKRGTTTFTVTDPDSASWQSGLVVIPANGTAEVRGGDTVVYKPNKGYVGVDSLVLGVTDSDGNTTEVELPIVVTDEGCGCQSTNPAAAWSFALLGLLALRRRRS